MKSYSTTQKRRYPIGWCPNCKHTVIYSNNPRDKSCVSIRLADENYSGKTILCSKCKSMVYIAKAVKLNK